MRTVQTDKLKRLQTLKGVLEENEDIWNGHAAFVRGVTKLGTLVPKITSVLQVQISVPDAAGEKRHARAALGDAAFEIAAAVLAYAEENDDTELSGRVDFSRSEILEGSGAAIVARCRDIHAAGTENLAELADAGVTAAKLTALKKLIDVFESLNTMPRQNLARRSAATRQIPVLIRQADRIVNRQLTKLVVQFKASSPEFYHAYKTAASIVNTGSRGKSKTEGNGTAPTTPTPNPA